MTRYEVRLSAAAERQLRKLALSDQRHMSIAFGKLENNPRPPGVEKLSAEDGYWRLRVGDYRIVYTIEDQVLLILVLKIGHRKDVYRKL